MSDKFYLGETVRFMTIVSNSPTSVVLTVVDPCGTDKITDLAMTEEADDVWVYYYTSAETDNAGTYVFRVEASNGLGKSIEEYKLDIYKQR